MYLHCAYILLYAGVEEAGSDEMMISLVQEAHIASVDIGDDRLGDDEWNILSNTASLVHYTTAAICICYSLKQSLMSIAGNGLNFLIVNHLLI